MALKLNQILAISSGKRSQVEKRFGEVYQLLQKGDLLEGLTRTYAPLSEEGEKLPPESKRLQLKVEDTLAEVSSALADLLDVTLIQDSSNCLAKADIKVGTEVIATGVPVTTLLFLDKKLTDFSTFVDKLPTLDPAYGWVRDAGQGCYATEPAQTARHTKMKEVIVKYPATTEHPAQTEMVDSNVLAGYWTQRKFSGAIPLAEKNLLASRVRKLLDAVKMAREEANQITVQEVAIGDSLFKYIFQK